MSPIAPPPTTATRFSGPTSASRHACHATEAGSTNAASAGSRPAGSGTRERAGARNHSLMPPSAHHSERGDPEWRTGCTGPRGRVAFTAAPEDGLDRDRPCRLRSRRQARGRAGTCCRTGCSRSRTRRCSPIGWRPARRGRRARRRRLRIRPAAQIGQLAREAMLGQGATTGSCGPASLPRRTLRMFPEARQWARSGPLQAFRIGSRRAA